MLLVISPSVNDAIVVRTVSTFAEDDDDGDDDDDDGDVDVDDVESVAATVIGAGGMVSPLNAPSIEPTLSLFRVNDNDGNDASTTCSALASICIVFDTTNSFIVPLK